MKLFKTTREKELEIVAETIDAITRVSVLANERMREIKDLSEKLERATEARIAAQVENEALKDKVARSGVEHRRRVAVLANALRHIEGVALADEPRDLPGIAQTARDALNHWGTKDEAI